MNREKQRNGNSGKTVGVTVKVEEKRINVKKRKKRKCNQEEDNGEDKIEGRK